MYKFNVDDHVTALIANMREMWRRKEMIDVKLLSADKKKPFNYHGIMLAACSDKFKEILSGAQMQFFR